MRIKAAALGFAAALVMAVAFGLCGVLFAIAPGPMSAFVGWVVHIDVSQLTRPISAADLVFGVLLTASYVGLLVGAVAALYNRFAVARTA